MNVSIMCCKKRDFYCIYRNDAIFFSKKENCIHREYIHAHRGSGDPNNEDGEYKRSIGLLYGIAFTIKMSKKGDHRYHHEIYLSNARKVAPEKLKTVIRHPIKLKES